MKPSPVKITLNPVKKSSQVHSIGYGSAYMVEARLKYQLKGGRVDFWYELNRPDKVLEDAAKTLTSTIKGDTGLPLFHGKPGV